MKRFVTCVLSLLLVVICPTAAFAQTPPTFSVTILPTLGGAYTQGKAINNNGYVTGFSITSSGYAHAFLYGGGSMTDLGTLGGYQSYGYAINNSNEVVGKSDTTTLSGGTQVSHAFKYAGGTMTDIITGSYSAYDPGIAVAINDSGLIIGYRSFMGGANQAFSYDSSGTTTNLTSTGVCHRMLYQGSIRQAKFVATGVQITAASLQVARVTIA